MTHTLYYVLGFILLAAFLFIAGQYLYVQFKLEKPTYKVISKTGSYEVREYEPYIIASAVVPNDGRSMNSGFSIVANYIFGNNTARNAMGSENIAMTTPVLDEPIKSEQISMTTPVIDEIMGDMRRVSFVMPREYTLETLPTPNNTQVEIQEVPKETWAVYTYSGYSTDAIKQEKYLEFVTILKQENIDHTGEWKHASYDPPSTLPPLRTNEVWIKIK